MTEKERALQLSHQIDRLLAGKTPDQHLSPSDQGAIQIASRLVQIMDLDEERTQEAIRQKLSTRISPENWTASIGILFNRVLLYAFVKFTGWVVPALVLFTLLIYPVRMDHLQPSVNSNYQNPPSGLQNEPAPAGIAVTESIVSLKLPDPVPTPMVGSSHFVSSQPTAQFTKPGTISIHPAEIKDQTPKPAPLATKGFEP